VAVDPLHAVETCTTRFLSVSPMFVPSLSWETMHQSFLETAHKRVCSHRGVGGSAGAGAVATRASPIALAQRLCQPRLDQVRPLLVVAEQHLRNERQEVYIRTSQLIVLSGERKREAVDSFIGWRITRTEQRSPSAKPFSSTSADSGQWPAKNASPFECFPCVRPEPVLVTGSCYQDPFRMKIRRKRKVCVRFSHRGG
jgi:hypothetical protein